MEQDLTRRLAVILHADVVGSTELVQKNETLAHARMRGLFHTFSGIINRYGGDVREIRGDALVACFDRASDAVCASLLFQKLNSGEVESTAANADDIHVELRIGIALGEVVIADGTITGAGVVLAQRLEQLAEAGGVCIQGAASETVPQRMPFVFKSQGEKHLKGFDSPVRVLTVNLAQGADVPPPEKGIRTTRITTQRPPARKWKSGMAGALLLAGLAGFGVFYYLENSARNSGGVNIQQTLSELPSIAVLPFENLSQDPDQNYFADGLADDLITDLTKVTGLIVAARGSSFSYRDRQVDFDRIAEDLGVRYLLDGSVRRSSDQVRINAQLVDTLTGKPVWSERFDQNLANIFEIQDEVTRKIVDALKLSLNPVSVRGDNPKSFDAYDMLLRALEVQARFTPRDNAEGRELFKKAALLDPSYARAHAGIALTHAIDVNMNWTRDRERSIELGLEAVGRALELDDEVVRAYFAQSALFLSQGRYDEAIENMSHVLELAPNYADGYAQLAFHYANAGRHVESLEAIQQAKALNPQYSQLYLYVEAISLYHLERYMEAVPLLIESIDRNPAFDRPQLLLAATYGQLGLIEEADWTLLEASMLRPEMSLENETRNSILAREEDRNRYIEGLRLAGLKNE